MSRNEQYDRAYVEDAFTVKSSIGKVGAAGRTHDQAKINAERLRHYGLMLTITKRSHP